MQYWLWLSILLLGGCGQLYAHQETFSAEHGAQRQHSFHAQAQANTGVINYTTPFFGKQQETIAFSQDENEEEEFSVLSFSPSKKIAGLNKPFCNYYYPEARELIKNAAQRPPSCKPFLPLSSRQYILFRVIRI